MPTRPARRALRCRSLTGAVLAVALLVGAAGCATSGSTTGDSTTSAGGGGDSSGTSLTTATASGTSLLVAEGHGWDAGGLYGPMPGAGTCQARTTSGGAALPDPACTPGVLDAAVTDATITTTICRPGGYTSSVRPPESLTGPAKAAAMRAYGVTGPMSDYEYDHFIPLSLGGASDVRNLWPEPNDPGMTGFARNAKDLVETSLWRAVCAGQVSLGAAQQAIVADWTTALAQARGQRDTGPSLDTPAQPDSVADTTSNQGTSAPLPQQPASLTDQVARQLVALGPSSAAKRRRAIQAWLRRPPAPLPEPSTPAEYMLRSAYDSLPGPLQELAYARPALMGDGINPVTGKAYAGLYWQAQVYVSDNAFWSQQRLNHIIAHEYAHQYYYERLTRGQRDTVDGLVLTAHQGEDPPATELFADVVASLAGAPGGGYWEPIPVEVMERIAPYIV